MQGLLLYWSTIGRMQNLGVQGTIFPSHYSFYAYIKLPPPHKSLAPNFPLAFIYFSQIAS